MEAAFKSFPDVAFEVRWRPFQLNADASLVGENKLQMYNRKFGADRVAAIVPHMTKMMAQIGVEYNMGGLTGNTFDSHRLLAWAETFGLDKQDALVEELFMNYFSQEKFLGDREVLVAAAAKAGLEGAKARELLADESSFKLEVQQQLTLPSKLRVSGVPFFVVTRMDGEEPSTAHTVSGAQEAESFVHMFEDMLE